MYIEMFNFWYFFFMLIQIGGIVGMYFALRKRKPFTQDVVLFSLLILGVVFHFLKMYIPPYSEIVNGELVITNRGWRDSWLVNICGANIFIFPIIYLTKNKHLKDYMFYIGVLTGVIVLFYPQEPIAKGDAVSQMEEFWDIMRFYFHHWIIIAVPLLLVLFKRHTLSYKRVWTAPVGLLLLMLFIVLNQIFQAELGFIPLRNTNLIPNFKNTSYIWGPLNQDGTMDPIGGIFEIFCPEVFKHLPVSCEGYGYEAGEIKYWPWFWMIIPCFILVTPLSFGLSLVFDFKNCKTDVVNLVHHIKECKLKDDFKNFKNRIVTKVTAPNPYYTKTNNKETVENVELDK